MWCIILLFWLLLRALMTPFSWDTKKWSVKWEELERMGLDTNMYLQRWKEITDSRLSHSTHHKPLQLQGFLSPLPLSAKQYSVCNRGTRAPVVSAVQRVPAQVPHQRWTMRLEIAAPMRLPKSLTSWNKKRLPEVQLKEATSPKVCTVSQGTFFS